MKKTILFAAASTAALLCSAVAFAQENQTGFVTLDLNWTAGGAPAESELDGDTMKQILERDQQRVKMIQERAKGATLTLELPQDRSTPRATVGRGASSKQGWPQTSEPFDSGLPKGGLPW